MFKLLILFFFCSSFVYSQKYDQISASYLLGHGYDAKTGLFGLAPMFIFTNDNNQLWKAPHSNKIYSVPDQMYVAPYDTVREIINQGTYQSYSDYLSMYKQWFTFDVGIEYNTLSLAFKYTKELGYIKEIIH